MHHVNSDINLMVEICLTECFVFRNVKYVNHAMHICFNSAKLIM